MNDSQHDNVLFFLAALFLGAVAAALTVILTGCGGAEFQAGLDDPRTDASAIDASADVPGATDDAARESAIADAARESAVESPDAPNLETSVNIPEASPVEAATCDRAACPNRCQFGNTPCCTPTGTCGCTDFGPTCI
jgi:hypothetical protein